MKTYEKIETSPKFPEFPKFPSRLAERAKFRRTTAMFLAPPSPSSDLRQVKSALSANLFPRRREGGREGGRDRGLAKERPQTDYVISGPMRRSKKRMGN